MKKTKILLAFLSKIEGNFEPLGIECLAGHINKIFGRRVAIKMSMAQNKKEIATLIKKITVWQPDILGLSLFFDTLDFLGSVMECVRKQSNPPKVILGNILATFNAEILLSEYPEIDAICMGSGELPMQNFVEYVQEKRDLSDIAGIAYKNRRKIYFTKISPSPIAIPERSFLKKIQQDPTGRIYLEASRGCPQRCAFCAQAKFFGFAKTEKTKEALYEEILFLAKKDVSLLDFVDEDLLSDNGKVALRVAEVIQELKKEGFLKKDAQIMCSLSVRALLTSSGKEVLRKLVEAGLSQCFIGIESFSKKQLERLGKKHTPKEAFRAIEMLKKNGVSYEMGSVIFEPETSLLDILQNCSGIKKAGAESISNPLNQWRALKETVMCHRLIARELVCEPYNPSWLSYEWYYASFQVAKIVYLAKNIESGLVLIEIAIKKIYRSEMFFKLPIELRHFIMQYKHNLNTIFLDFLEDMAREKLAGGGASFVAIKERHEERARLFLMNIQKSAPIQLRSIKKAAKIALALKKSGHQYLALPQDVPKKSV